MEIETPFGNTFASFFLSLRFVSFPLLSFPLLSSPFLPLSALLLPPLPHLQPPSRIPLLTDSFRFVSFRVLVHSRSA